MIRSRTLAAAALAAAGLAAVAATPAAGVRDGARARGYALDGSTHAPRAGARWTATVRGRSGRVSLDVVFGSKVVGHLTKGTIRHGRFRHTVRWPARSVGYPLIVRATVAGPHARVRLDYRVKVHR